MHQWADTEFTAEQRKFIVRYLILTGIYDGQISHHNMNELVYHCEMMRCEFDRLPLTSSCHAGLLYRKWQYAYSSFESKVFLRSGRRCSFVQSSNVIHETSIEIESSWIQSVFDSKASFAYLTEGKRNPSPLPSLHSHSNFKHLITRARINFCLSFQTLKSVQRSN